MPRKGETKELTIKKLVAELKELYLRDDTEMRGRGLYQRLIANISILNGHVDKDTELVARIKEVILKLEKLV